MFDKRLFTYIKDSKKYIAGNVLAQWISLLANIIMMYSITRLLSGLYYGNLAENQIFITGAVMLAAIAVRFAASIVSSKMSYYSSKSVKRTLRELVYNKLLRLGAAYKEKVNTSEVVQLSVEGVDQLETYFGMYLPQLFYAVLAPLTLFIVIAPINLTAAIVLMVCVPLIPVSIVIVQKWAKKLLSKYWGQYTALGDTFLENLQGLTTLKIYQSDEYKNHEMNHQAELFRKITMKVLTMQLNSITIMDLIAYGGAGIGVIISVIKFQSGAISLQEALLIILLSADFFIPMRQLGSFFHIAMNGMAASDKIFKLLAIEEKEDGKETFSAHGDIVIKDLGFSYDGERKILNDINIEFKKGSFTSIVGVSGSGKSTIAALLMSKNHGYEGNISIGNVELSEISETSLMNNVTYIGHNSYLFKGSVRENLLIAKGDATDEELWEALEKTNMAGFLKGEDGLETLILEKGSNLSGGQCQRLALARAILHDTPFYIFDEATSNIDAESENDIMKQIYKMAENKTVILISHRLANVTGSDKIYVIDKGQVKEQGTHAQLLEKGEKYAQLWQGQQSYENYGKEA